MGKKNEKGKEIRTCEEPEKETLRWLTEKRDKHRVFNYQEEKEVVEKTDEHVFSEELVEDKKRKNVKIY